MEPIERIDRPAHPALDRLVAYLKDHTGALESPGGPSWPRQSLEACAAAGVFAWFVEPDDGGFGWSEADRCAGYVRLAAGCLTTTFVITQHVGACRRLAASRAPAKARFLPDLVSGRRWATVGISHLTTSRRHVRQPVLRAEARGSGFVLEGEAPWVTSSPHADVLVVAAELDDRRQILAAVERESEGVEIPEPFSLVALSASCTGPVKFHGTFIPEDQILAGPSPDVMAGGRGGTTGGLQTSALALGLADAAIGYLEAEAERRGNLGSSASALRDQWHAAYDDLMALARGAPRAGLDRSQLRRAANSLVLRATQSTLVAAKGAGFVSGHPANRWCREALFFLVWSCPQDVADANLCELAQGASGRPEEG